MLITADSEWLMTIRPSTLSHQPLAIGHGLQFLIPHLTTFL